MEREGDGSQKWEVGSQESEVALKTQTLRSCIKIEKRKTLRRSVQKRKALGEDCSFLSQTSDLLLKIIVNSKLILFDKYFFKCRNIILLIEHQHCFFIVQGINRSE